MWEVHAKLSFEVARNFAPRYKTSTTRAAKLCFEIVTLIIALAGSIYFMFIMNLLSCHVFYYPLKAVVFLLLILHSQQISVIQKL